MGRLAQTLGLSFTATVNFIFRLPRFPVILDTNEELIVARTKMQLISKIVKLNINDEDKRNIIDSSAEGFAFYPKANAISPSITIRKWNKRQIIELFNARRPAGTPEMPDKSLGSRTLGSIVLDAIELIQEKNSFRSPILNC